MLAIERPAAIVREILRQLVIDGDPAPGGAAGPAGGRPPARAPGGARPGPGRGAKAWRRAGAAAGAGRRGAIERPAAAAGTGRAGRRSRPCRWTAASSGAWWCPARARARRGGLAACRRSCWCWATWCDRAAGRGGRHRARRAAQPALQVDGHPLGHLVVAGPGPRAARRPGGVPGQLLVLGGVVRSSGRHRARRAAQPALQVDGRQLGRLVVPGPGPGAARRPGGVPAQLLVLGDVGVVSQAEYSRTNCHHHCGQKGHKCPYNGAINKFTFNEVVHGTGQERQH